MYYINTLHVNNVFEININILLCTERPQSIGAEAETKPNAEKRKL